MRFAVGERFMARSDWTKEVRETFSVRAPDGRLLPAAAHGAGEGGPRQEPERCHDEAGREPLGSCEQVTRHR